MYKITSGGEVVGYSETAVYIRRRPNGCYAPCGENEAEGFCVKIVEETDDGAELNDTVFALSSGALGGDEPVGEIEMISGAIKIAENDKVFNILLGKEP